MATKNCRIGKALAFTEHENTVIRSKTISTDLNTARNQAGVSSYYVPGYSGSPKTINLNRTGRYVRVQLAASQYLVLAEVKVWQAGSSTPISTDGISSLAYDSTTNRITTSGFAYDAAGNQARAVAPYGGSQKFQYDAANRLANVRTDTDQLIATYTYGDTNERLIADETGLRTYYAPGGLAEYTESGSSTTPTWSKSSVYLGARLLATLQPNGSGGEYIQYHHPDRLGTRLVTNAADTTYFEQQTLPFGTALNETPYSGATTGATNRRFTSYDRSLTTGLDYAINRHYDPNQGRFTQVDPIGMRSTNLSSPQTLNLYAYCTSDPINHTDPRGLGFFSFISKIFRAVKKVLKVVAIVVAVALAVVFSFALLSLPGTQFLADIVFKGLGLLLKFIAKIGVMGFAEGGGITIGLTGKIFAGAMTVGAIANHLQQRKRGKEVDMRKKDPIVAIIVDLDTMKTLAELTQAQLDKYQEEANDYKACVDREWDIFKRKIEEVKAAAQKHFEENDLPWPIKLLSGIASGIGGDAKSDSVESGRDRVRDMIPEIINIMRREQEIKDGTQKAAENRDQAIKNNCKEPALP